MKQAVLTAPGRFEIVDAPVPSPRQGEALVRVKAVGVCGSDLHMFSEGAIGGIRIEDAGGPFVPGHECMGIVETVGPATERKLVGRRVFVEPQLNCQACHWCRSGQPNVCPQHTFLGLPPQAGCLAEYMTHPLRLCEPLPNEISDDAGVLLEPLAVAVHSMDRVIGHGRDAHATHGQDAHATARATAGQVGPTVVLGAGSIGLTHVMLLSAAGAAPLIVTDVLDYRLEAARRLGATHTFNPRRDDVVKAVLSLTGGLGAQFVFECAGQKETFAQMVACAGPAAHVGVVGIPAVDELSFQHSLARRKGLDVLMIRRANLTFARALEQTLARPLPLDTLATHHWPLDRCQQAFETAAGYRDGVIKAVVRP